LGGHFPASPVRDTPADISCILYSIIEGKNIDEEDSNNIEEHFSALVVRL
jgi:hypothetical protein